jgi:hypothetical protein
MTEPANTRTCSAPKDTSVRGIGGERCGKPATKILPTGWYCEECHAAIKARIDSGVTLLNMLRDAYVTLKKSGKPPSEGA